MKPRQYILKAKKALKKIKTVHMEFIISGKDGKTLIHGFID